MPLTKDLTKFTTASPITATFTSSELIEGLGVLDFQGYQTTNSAATDYHLSTNAFWSDAGYISTTGSTNTSSYDFDTAPFELARTVSGEIIVSFTHGIFAGAGGGGNTNAVTVAVYRYDGSTETLIGTVTSPTITSTASTLSLSTRIMKISATETLIPKGDQIRVKVTMAWAGASGSFTHYFGNDPANRALENIWGHSQDTTVNPAYFKIKVPFKIDE